MGVGKYKYYFRKPKSEIVKDVFSWLAIAGAITIAATSPYFVRNLLDGYKMYKRYKKRDGWSKQKISNVFYRLKRDGLISVKRINNQIYISLTPEGKKKAGMLQIDNLEIKKPKKWDKKWRLLSFDIAEKKKIVRESLRGKLKELGFCPFQKSIWVHPFDCRAEIELLKDFFGLFDKEVQLIIAENIGEERGWKKIFKLDT